ncbi:unnamed protein product [Paramecium sonneborni]|uniref:IBR domain protein n=1 Tax=Paramecium sonneborni TaxID=65129 RepID=A0A8S1QZE4_9CILI|nr:unnamed protein product [Paramecium sonneborni]
MEMQTNQILWQQKDLILDVFILGSLFKQNKKENKVQFKHHFDLIKTLREQINLQIISSDRVFELFDQYYEKDQDIFYLFQELKQERQRELRNDNSKQIVNDQKVKKIEQQTQQNQHQLQQLQKVEMNQIEQKGQFNQETNEQFLQDQVQIDNDLEDYKIALQLQKQFDDETNQETQQVKQLNLYLLNQQQDKQIQCSICLDIIEFSQIIMLTCIHQFHHECINQHCLTQIQSRSFPIICPIIECKENINYSDLKEILEDKALQTYQKFTFQQYVDTHSDEYSWCPTPDCQYVFIAGSPQFNCPVCNKEYCLSCKVEYHQNLTCQEYIENQKRQQLNANPIPYNQNNLPSNNYHFQIKQQNPQMIQINQKTNKLFQNNQNTQLSSKPLNNFTNSTLINQSFQINQNNYNQQNLINQQSVQQLQQINRDQQFLFQNKYQTLNKNVNVSQQFINIQHQFNNTNNLKKNNNQQQIQFLPQPKVMQFQQHNNIQTRTFQNQIQINNNYVDINQQLNSKQLDDQFTNLMMISKCKQCPNCKSWVEKSSGCDHMTCRCKFQFCYACGGVYLKCACINKLFI